MNNCISGLKDLGIYASLKDVLCATNKLVESNDCSSGLLTSSCSRADSLPILLHSVGSIQISWRQISILVAPAKEPHDLTIDRGDGLVMSENYVGKCIARICPFTPISSVQDP